MRRRQGADTPITVGRVDDEHLLGALVAAHPELDEVKPALDPVADAEAHVARAPEVRE
jgi:hypothetical protein